MCVRDKVAVVDCGVVVCCENKIMSRRKRRWRETHTLFKIYPVFLATHRCARTDTPTARRIKNNARHRFVFNYVEILNYRDVVHTFISLLFHVCQRHTYVHAFEVTCVDVDVQTLVYEVASVYVDVETWVYEEVYVYVDVDVDVYGCVFVYVFVFLHAGTNIYMYICTCHVRCSCLHLCVFFREWS